MKAKQAKKAATHPWAELCKLSSMTISQLKVLHVHYTTLNRFCVDPETIEKESETATEGSASRDADEKAQGRPLTSSPPTENHSLSETSIEIPFEHYAQCVHTLIKHGTASQQFEYLFQTYAIESERGISRIELFQLLKEHFRSDGANASGKPASGATSPGPATETRHFERLYTWLKKHFNMYDRARCGFLTLSATVDMLGIHPDAFYHFQFHIEPFIKKLGENNRQYEVKARAADIQL